MKTTWLSRLSSKIVTKLVTFHFVTSLIGLNACDALGGTPIYRFILNKDKYHLYHSVFLTWMRCSMCEYCEVHRNFFFLIIITYIPEVIGEIAMDNTSENGPDILCHAMFGDFVFTRYNRLLGIFRYIMDGKITTTIPTFQSHVTRNSGLLSSLCASHDSWVMTQEQDITQVSSKCFWEYIIYSSNLFCS